MKIEYSLVDHSFYFRIGPALLGNKNSFVDSDAVIFIDDYGEWVGLETKNRFPQRIQWNSDRPIAATKVQEVIIDCYAESVVGFEVILWVENQDVLLSTLVKESLARQGQRKPESTL